MDTIYIRVRGEVLGPLSRDAARAAFLERKLTPSHEVSHDGTTWFPAAQIWTHLREELPMEGRGNSPPATIVAEPKPRPMGAAPKSRKPPSTVTSPPPPPVRSPARTPTPPVVRPPSVELSADAKTPTAEEIEIAPVPAGLRQTTASILLSTAIVAQLGALGTFIYIAWRNLELLRQWSGESLTKVVLDERRREWAQLLNNASFGVLIGGLVAFVLYGFWIYFTDDVLHRRRLRRLRYSQWWCVGWEVIPLANLWFPYQVLAEVWHGAATRTKANWRGKFPLVILLYGILQFAIRVPRPYLQYLSYSLGVEYEAVKSAADVTTYREHLASYLTFEFATAVAAVPCYLLFLLIVVRISLKLRLGRPRMGEPVAPAAAEPA
jgi:hypothetical protein